ncbi:MAG: hypothetical protein C0599_02540 [Salinivirgaceae bacterium]|nr:MAG: hypothetical protein C0599_02540 [Salinivirgaceae bacterium]
MKLLIVINSLIIVFLFGCTSGKELLAPESLYESADGEKKSHQSYDKVMELWTVDFQSEYVETDYGKSHVIIAGKKDNPPLVLIPGLFADATMWCDNAGELSKHFRVIALDMPNYGGKSQPENKAVTELNDYKKWFTQVLDHYEISQTPVAGLSYGSWLALALAREMPDRISQIVLLDPSETFMPMNGGIAWKGFKYFMFFPNRNKYERFFDWMGGGFTNEKIEIWMEHMLDVIEFGSVGMFDIPQHRIYEKEELTTVKMPVLIMVGGKPILYDNPEEFKVKASSVLPHAEIIIVENAGHGLNAEKPEIVNQHIIDFIKKNSSVNDNE